MTQATDPNVLAAAAKHIRGATIAWGGGRYFDLINPESTPIDIESYAFALAYTCRWRGQTMRFAKPWWRLLLGMRARRMFYGVGQHVVIGTEEMMRAGYDREDCLAFLGHESDEVPWPDFPGPSKILFPPEVKATIKRSGDALDRQFGFECRDPDLIKRWDVRMLVTEKRDLLEGFERDVWHNGGNGGQTSIEGFSPFARRIIPYRHPDEAARRFLKLYRELSR